MKRHQYEELLERYSFGITSMFNTLIKLDKHDLLSRHPELTTFLCCLDMATIFHLLSITKAFSLPENEISLSYRYLHEVLNAVSKNLVEKKTRQKSFYI